MREITRILCPTDFSDASRHAVGYARALARFYRARLIGLYVQPPVLVPVPAFEMAGYPTASSPDSEDLTALQHDVVDALRGTGEEQIPIDAAIRAGNVAPAIVAYARTLPADLIVMGTHGAGGFEHLMLGSVAEKVLRKAQCPVLTVSPKSTTPAALPFTRVLCPIDFSDLSRAIVEFAGSLAREGGGGITLLHVLEWPTEEEPAASRHFNVPEYRRYREQDARAQLQALATDTIHDGYQLETRLGHGKPYREILAAAIEANADLIVMGVQGRNALDLMLFGSTTNHVVRRSTCPVLTLRQ